MTSKANRVRIGDNKLETSSDDSGFYDDSNVDAVTGAIAKRCIKSSSLCFVTPLTSFHPKYVASFPLNCFWKCSLKPSPLASSLKFLADVSPSAAGLDRDWLVCIFEGVWCVLRGLREVWYAMSVRRKSNRL